MQQLIVLTLIAVLPATGASAQYDLFYDVHTGELTITTTGNIIGYTLESSDAIFLEDAALTPSNHTPFVSYQYVNGAPVSQVGTSASTPKFLGESYALQSLPAGVYNLGRVLPAGLSEAQLQTVWDIQATYLSGIGIPATAFNTVHLTPLIPGDTDYDYDVDDADLGNSFSNYTGPSGAGNKGLMDGDTDGDGDVDDADLGASFAHYSGPLAPAVPEPGALAVAGLVGLALFGRCSRKRAVSESVR